MPEPESAHGGSSAAQLLRFSMGGMEEAAQSDVDGQGMGAQGVPHPALPAPHDTKRRRTGSSTDGRASDGEAMPRCESVPGWPGAAATSLSPCGSGRSASATWLLSDSAADEEVAHDDDGCSMGSSGSRAGCGVSECAHGGRSVLSVLREMQALQAPSAGA